MSTAISRLLALSVVFLLVAPPATRAGGTEAEEAEPRQDTAEAGEDGIEPGAKAAWLHRLGEVEDKTLALARAMPAEVLAWRPMKGVASGVEALGHVAFTQYKLAEMVGAAVPEGVDLEAIGHPEGKAEAVRNLEASYAHLRRAIEAVPDDALDRPAKFWGRPSTVRRILLKSVTHSAEHLGQLVAYARMNRVVPPWSREAEESDEADAP